MRKPLIWVLLLSALAVILGGLLYEALGGRDAPLNQQTLAAMSEAEQVAWLMERILERSEPPSAFREYLYQWFPRLRVKYHYLYPSDVSVLLWMCAEYNQPELLQQMRRWVEIAQVNETYEVCEAHIWSKRGEWAKALQRARQLATSSHEESLEVYAALARAQARAGNRQEARRTLQEAAATQIRIGSLSYPIVSAAARLGFPQIAETLTQPGLAHHLWETSLGCEIVRAYARAGQPTEAVRAARSIKNWVLRGIAYAEIARALIERQQSAQAFALLEQAAEPVGYARTAQYLTEQRRLSQARALWHKAEQLAVRASEPMRSRLLYQVAAERARAGELDAARRLYDQIKLRRDIPEQAEALFQLAEAYAAAGKVNEAVALLRKQFVRCPADDYQLAFVACILSERGYHSEARALMQQIRVSIQREYTDWRDAPIWETVVSMLSHSQAALPLARELLAWLESEAQAVRDPEERTRIHHRLMELYAIIGDIPRAVHHAAQLPDREQQTSALIDLLRTLAQRTDSE